MRRFFRCPSGRCPGCPGGRLLDLCNQKLLDLSHVEIFVLDEADRMLDMGFIHDVRKVIVPGDFIRAVFGAGEDQGVFHLFLLQDLDQEGGLVVPVHQADLLHP